MRLLHDVVSVEPVDEDRLRIRFDDGLEGVVDVSRLLAMSGVFEPLRELSFFRQVQVHPELRVVCWPNGADLDSEVLYAKVSAKQWTTRT